MCDIIWMLSQSHISLSVRPHFWKPGNVGMRLRSVKSQDKGPKSGKSRGICVAKSGKSRGICVVREI